MAPARPTEALTWRPVSPVRRGRVSRRVRGPLGPWQPKRTPVRRPPRWPILRAVDSDRESNRSRCPGGGTLQVEVREEEKDNLIWLLEGVPCRLATQAAQGYVAASHAARRRRRLAQAVQPAARERERVPGRRYAQVHPRAATSRAGTCYTGGALLPVAFASPFPSSPRGPKITRCHYYRVF